MKTAALFVALFTIVVGIAGIVSPEYGTMVRRGYFATPTTFYAAVALRLVMGLVIILAAATSRAPKTLRALGAVMCLQALTATVLGPDHARAVAQWETMQGTALLRVGAAVALAAGGFMAFAIIRSRPRGALAQTGLSRPRSPTSALRLGFLGASARASRACRSSDRQKP